MRGGDNRAIHSAILLISAVLFLLLLWRTYWSAEDEVPQIPAPVVVEISGDVPNPGTYLLERGRATVAGALAAAGLFGFEADDKAAIQGGTSLGVVKTESGPRVTFGRMRAGSRLAAGLKIDLNSATEEDLKLVPQMRAEFAAAIVKRRFEKPWEKVADLAEIHGIGEKTAQKFEEFLEVQRDDLR